MDAVSWSVDVFGDAMLGDERRTKRLTHIAASMADGPERSVSSNLGNEASNKAAQRFFSNGAFDYSDVAAPACDWTIDKFSGHNRVLLIQDTSHLNYDTHKATLGLGHVGSTKDKSFLGLMMHWTLALGGQGQTLGLAHLKLWQRKVDPRKASLNAHQNKPIEAKESFKWIEALNALDGRLPLGVEPVWVSDRESDIYEYIDAVMARGHDFVIRANNSRVIGDAEGLLKERAREAPIVGRQQLELTDRNGKKKSVGVTIRCCDLNLVAQRRKGGAKSATPTADLDLHVVHVSSKGHGIEWILLTSLPVETLDESLEVIWIYKQRWHIECVHKTLKSGFRAEELTLDDAEGLKRALAIMLPCAIRIYWMTHLQKHTPDEPASRVLSTTECALLLMKNRKPTSYMPSIKEAWRWIGLMGGFRGSKNAQPPGQITFWRGLVRLKDMAAGADMILEQIRETQKCVH